MTLLQNGIASSLLTLCVLILGALLWRTYAAQLDVLAVGWVFGVGTIVLMDRVKRWWRAG
jgi:hypothetical protein